MIRLALAVLPLALAACQAKVGTEADNTDRPDTVKVAADGNGSIALDLPGFNGRMKLPAALMQRGNVDLDGVKLYPGAKLGRVNVDAGQAGAKVNATFDAPAPVDQVRGWYRQALRDKGIMVTERDGVLSGTTTEGAAFRLSFAPNGGGTTGTIAIVDRA